MTTNSKDNADKKYYKLVLWQKISLFSIVLSLNLAKFVTIVPGISKSER